MIIFRIPRNSNQPSHHSPPNLHKMRTIKIPSEIVVATKSDRNITAIQTTAPIRETCQLKNRNVGLKTKDELVMYCDYK